MPEVAAQLDMEFAVVTDCPPLPNPTWREGTAKQELGQLLRDFWPELCPVHRLQAITAKYTQRVSQMRDYYEPLGWTIKNREDKARNLSWYRFERI